MFFCRDFIVKIFWALFKNQAGQYFWFFTLCEQAYSTTARNQQTTIECPVQPPPANVAFTIPDTIPPAQGSAEGRFSIYIRIIQIQNLCSECLNQLTILFQQKSLHITFRGYLFFCLRNFLPVFERSEIPLRFVTSCC